MNSLWSEETAQPERPALAGDIKTEVCIIGAGMAGVLIGHELKRKGIPAVLLERNRTGGGVTKNTTAKITAQHGLIYARLISDIGEKAARQYAEANLRAVGRFAEIAERGGVDCDFQRLPAYVYSRGDSARICREVKAACSLGIPAELASGDELPFSVKGAVRFPNQAAFHPLKFLNGVARHLEIYENTEATELLPGVVVTPHGRVTARHIVVATHYPIWNFPGWYFLRMHQQRSYAMALTAPEGIALPLQNGMYIDADPDGWSFRPAGGHLIMGGAGHRSGQNRRGGSYSRILQAARGFYPALQPSYEWSTQDCMTHDGIPFIGRYSASVPHLYIATGFNKWGMTSSMAAAIILSSLIEGRECGFADAFSPQRFNVTASLGNLRKDVGQSAKGLLLGAAGIARSSLDALLPGHGGIVRCEGKRVGAYRSEEGEVFLVSPRCTHLGCQLEWNPEERTWDCPCHGSRFGYDGHVIEAPAAKPLERY